MGKPVTWPLLFSRRDFVKVRTRDKVVGMEKIEMIQKPFIKEMVKDSISDDTL